MSSWITRILRTPGSIYLSVGMLIGASAVVGMLGLRAFNARAEAPATRLALTQSEQNILVNLESAFSKIVEQVSPAVVSIKAKHRLGNDNILLRMGGRDSVDGEGSGVIIRSDGWILTNDHVVRGADTVTVEMADGRHLEGTVRRDFLSDIAVVKVKASGLPTLPLGDSEGVKPGQFAIAVGSPFGLENSVTIGHISALARSQVVPDQLVQRGRYYPTMIQTDAAINPGNSGGPLINIRGEVIGINTAIASEVGGSMGVGFAIPINNARDVAEQLIERGKVSRGFLGLTPVDLTPDDKERLGVTSGAKVDEVPETIKASAADPGSPSPAFKAGIKKDDVITAINGTKIVRAIDLRQKMLHIPPGQTANLTLMRDKQQKTIAVTVGKSPNDVDDEEIKAKIAQDNAKSPGIQIDPKDFGNFEGSPVTPGAKGKLGVQVAAPTAELKDQFQLKGDIKGVIVVEVQPGTPADRFGIQPGDVIEKLNGKAITEPAKLKELVDAAKGNYSLTLRRSVNGNMATINIQIQSK